MSYLEFAKESWQKTYGEKSLIWKAYSLACLLLSLVVFVPVIILMSYLFRIPEAHALINHSSAFLTIFISALILVFGLFYSIFIFASIPYLCLRYLQDAPISISVAIKKVLLHKWKIFLNWLLFLVLYSILHLLMKKLFLTNVFLVNTYMFTLILLVWNISTLNILDKNKSAWAAFTDSWQLAIQNIPFFLLTGFWTLLLYSFSIVTLLIGSIWALPAQYNTFVMFYQKTE